MSSLVHCGTCSPLSISCSSSGVKGQSFSIGNTAPNPSVKYMKQLSRTFSVTIKQWILTAQANFWKRCCTIFNNDGLTLNTVGPSKWNVTLGKSRFLERYSFNIVYKDVMCICMLLDQPLSVNLCHTSKAKNARGFLICYLWMRLTAAEHRCINKTVWQVECIPQRFLWSASDENKGPHQ